MNPVPAQREYFLDSIRAWLMLLGIPFHISLIYSSHTWHVNSAEPSLWLTLFNDFIHSFRMQVFFVISGYFSYMLFLRYPLKKWWKVRVERVGNTSKGKRKVGLGCHCMTNIIRWPGN